MTDINNWRRKIRSKTPTLGIEERQTEIASTLDSLTSPRRSRPKLSTFLSYGHAAPALSDPEPFSVDQWNSQTIPEKPYRPDIANMVQSIMATILSEPFKGLSPAFNSQIMHVFEEYQKVVKEKEQLLVATRHDEDGQHWSDLRLRRAAHELQETIQQREAEKEYYKAEIMRLEQVNLEATKGRSDTQAGDRSMLRRRAKSSSSMVGEKAQTVFEFLKGSRRTTERTSSAVVLPRSSTTSNLVAGLAPPLSLTRDGGEFHMDGTSLGSRDLSLNTLNVAANRRRGEAAGEEATKILPAHESEVQLSDDNYSSFGSTGDALPDEIRNVFDANEGSDTLNMSLNDNYSTIRNLAEQMAHRRGMNFNEALTTIVNTVYGDTAPALSPRWSANMSTGKSETSFEHRRHGLPFRFQRTSSSGSHCLTLEKPLLKNGETDNLALLNPDSQQVRRVFSFYSGDDSKIDISRESSGSVRHTPSTVKRECSLSDFNHASTTPCPLGDNENKGSPKREDELSPLPRPPLRNTELGSNSSSRDPSIEPHVMPRRKRETSHSSVATVIHCSPAHSAVSPNNTRHSSLQSVISAARSSRQSESGASSLEGVSNRTTNGRGQGEPKMPSQSAESRRASTAAAVAAVKAADDREAGISRKMGAQTD